MQFITVGLVPAPQLPTEIVYKLSERLEKDLQEFFQSDICWKIDIKIDRLTGAADTVKEIMDEAGDLKEKNEWEYAISLTDLPVFYDHNVVIADADVDDKVALISLPAFGLTPTSHKVKLTMLQMIKELYYRNIHTNKSIQFSEKRIGIVEKKSNQHFFGKLVKVFRFASIRRLEYPEKKDGVSIRFFIKPKWSGLPTILSGMTIANQPWTIMPSFKKVVGLAFATGSYMLVFTTLWELSSLYGLARLILVMLFAIGGMTIWTIIAHNLWEKRDTGESSKTSSLRFIYNASTVFTLLFSIILFYISLFLLFLFAVIIFVPPDMFEKTIDSDVGPMNYLALVWLVSSAATVAGAIGAGLENADQVRESTYGYRQYIRSKAMEETEKEEEKYTDKKTTNKKE